MAAAQDNAKQCSRYSTAKLLKKQKSLPTYVPFNDKMTQVVRLKKIDGKIYQDCDVYIGPKMCNPSWTFDKSPWVNPFHYSYKDRSEVLKAYKQYVLTHPKLQKQLKTLRGKRLGCFCENLEFCHGTVLKNLVESESELARTNHQKVHGSNFFFKGEDSPFSNLHPEKLTSLDKENTFSCGEHYRLFLIAKRFNKQNIMSLLESLSHIKHDCRTLRSIASSLYSAIQEAGEKYTALEQIADMIKVVEAKYQQSKVFRALCRETYDKTIVEATENTFWGVGVDMSKLQELVKIHGDELSIFSDHCPGQNVLGFIIMYVAARHEAVIVSKFEKGDIPPAENFSDQYYSFLQAMDRFKKTSVPEHGLERSMVIANPGLQYLRDIVGKLTSKEKDSECALGLDLVIGGVILCGLFQ